MKRLFSVALCIAMILTTVLLSGCFSCDHDFGRWKTETEPTCTKSGEKYRVCQECDFEETEELDRLPHTEVDDPAKEPTCTEIGLTEGKHCSVCNEVLVAQEEISVIEHDYVESVKTQAFCDTPGTKEFECSVCEDTYTESFEAQEYTATEIHELVKESVAEITTYDKDGEGLSLGTGFVYDGNIVTNYHVIDQAYSAKITINDKTYDAETVVAYDKDLDLAVLKLDTNGDVLKSLSICDADHEVGATVYAFGNPRGFTATFSQGILTHAKREMEGVTYVQHDAAISNGNSGGPLINQYCEVIGINTLTVKDSQNLNFAISVSHIGDLQNTNLSFEEFYEKEGIPDVVGKYMLNSMTANGVSFNRDVIVAAGMGDCYIELKANGTFVLNNPGVSAVYGTYDAKKQILTDDSGVPVAFVFDGKTNSITIEEEGVTMTFVR